MSSRKKKQKELLENVVIEQIAAEGKSLSHIDGKVLFVPQTIPGDIVDVQVTRIKSSYMEGRVVRLVTPSKDRLTPFCSHFGVCGGCTWQILPYQKQIDFKQQQIEDQLSRIGKLKFPSISPILGSEDTVYYRNKLEFTFSDRRWVLDGENPEGLFSAPIQLDPKDFEGGVFPRYLRMGYSSINTCQNGFGLGFHVGGAFDKVLDINKCLLQMEPSNEIRNFIREYSKKHNLSYFNLREQKGLLRNIVVRNNKAGDFMLTLSCTSLELDKNGSSPIFELLSAIRDKFPQIKSLNYVINTKGNDTIGDLPVVNFAGEDAIYEEMEDLKFKIGPKSFFQTNSKQAYRLYCVVREFAELKGNEKVYDLYTGTGTIALFVARHASSVIGIEYVPEAIEDAKINAKVNGIDNCDFYAGDMKDILTNEFISQHGGSPDVIILDPPRAGIHPDVAQVILDAKPSRIVYVSCNPATQARDLSILAVDYDITKVQPVDMFPHTIHVENVVALKRK